MFLFCIFYLFVKFFGCNVVIFSKGDIVNFYFRIVINIKNEEDGVDFSCILFFYDIYFYVQEVFIYEEVLNGFRRVYFDIFCNDIFFK